MKSDIGPEQAVEWLAKVAVSGQERRIRAQVMEKLAEPPGWLDQNVFAPLAKHITAPLSESLKVRPEAVQRIGGGMLGGLAGGAGLGLLSGMTEPRKRRNILQSMLTGSLLGGTLGTAGGVGYDYWRQNAQGPGVKEEPKPAAPANAGELGVKAVTEGAPAALGIGNSNAAKVPLAKSVAQTFGKPPEVGDMGKYLANERMRLRLDPDKVRQLVGNPAAIHKMVSDAAINGGLVENPQTGALMAISNTGAPGTVRPEEVEQMLNSIPTTPVGPIGQAANWVSKHTQWVPGGAMAQALLGTGLVDTAGRAYRHYYPHSKDIIEGIRNTSEPPGLGHHGFGDDVAAREAADAAAAHGGNFYRATKQPVTNAHEDLVTAQRAAQRNTPEYQGAFQEHVRQHGPTVGTVQHYEQAAAERILERQRALQAASRQAAAARERGIELGRGQGGGFAGSPKLRGWKKFLPYAGAGLGSYLMSDGLRGAPESRISQLYDPEFVSRLRATDPGHLPPSMREAPQ